jgi:hypothetical protein
MQNRQIEAYRRSSNKLDADTNRVTNQYREYECDNCGYPKGGKQKVVIVNEQIGISDSKITAGNQKGNEDKKREH